MLLLWKREQRVTDLWAQQIFQGDTRRGGKIRACAVGSCWAAIKLHSLTAGLPGPLSMADLGEGVVTDGDLQWPTVPLSRGKLQETCAWGGPNFEGSSSH